MVLYYVFGFLLAFSDRPLVNYRNACIHAILRTRPYYNVPITKIFVGEQSTADDYPWKALLSKATEPSLLTFVIHTIVFAMIVLTLLSDTTSSNHLDIIVVTGTIITIVLGVVLALALRRSLILTACNCMERQFSWFVLRRWVARIHYFFTFAQHRATASFFVVRTQNASYCNILRCARALPHAENTRFDCKILAEKSKYYY